ncbi:ABC transporter permease [Candidatus Mycoplasma mahonii]|uniref:ABC transporter permease n=1 Tax=Candidatus Mycoplasma mahonii TaxID=3004105 RepID=UPI0026EE88C0|nr:ABC transporter permease [Candidatus Mycoplasma mahonii]WKX02781.1 ABC transporter permease [Candidatus Mycoplasma mahonii]
MRATFILLNSYFWKTVYGPIISFVIPFILLSVLGHIFKVEYVYPGIIALSLMFIGLLSLPLAIMEFKRTAIFKYIGSSPVNTMRFTITVVVYFVFISIISSIIIFLTTMALFSSESFPNGSITRGIMGGIFATVAGFFSFFIASGIHLLFVIASGILIATFSKTPQQALTIGICIIIPSMFLSGMIISVDIIAHSPVLNWISRVIPYRYSTGNIIIASTPIEQVGDILKWLTPDQKRLIFKSVEDSGVINITDGVLGNKSTPVHNVIDLINAQNNIPENFELHNILDKRLYELVIKRSIDLKAMYSDNNIFQWTHSWAVQRIPEPDAIKLFLAKYLATYKNNSNIDNPVITKIIDGDYTFLDVFMKQTNILYYKPDRVLNLLLPLSMIILSTWYISKNFKWSIR